MSELRTSETVVTLEFLQALAAAQAALRCRAAELRAEPQYSGNDTVGRIASVSELRNAFPRRISAMSDIPFTSKTMTDRELYLLTECTEWSSCSHSGCKARREIERLRAVLQKIGTDCPYFVWADAARKALGGVHETTGRQCLRAQTTVECGPNDDCLRGCPLERRALKATGDESWQE